MKNSLSKQKLERYSRQIILKDIGILGQKKIVIKPGENALVPTGISIAIPEDTEVQIRPRSGLAAKNNVGVLNTPGTIDSDYRGEIKVILFNHGDKDFTVNNDDRIAQMILMPILKVDFETVETLTETIRGSGGFGSTGKWKIHYQNKSLRDTLDK